MQYLYKYFFTSELGVVEFFACIFTLWCVWQVSQQSIWNFVTGTVGVILYGYLFYEVKLYADATLQLAYFLPIQLYGYWYWYTQGPKPDTLAVATCPPTLGLTGMGLIGIGTYLAGYFYTWVGASLPYPDSFILCASIWAQFLLSRKYLDSWVYWIIVDIVAIPVYTYKELYVTAGLYTILLFMACNGLLKWKNALNETKNELRSW